MNEFTAKLDEARQKLPLKRLMEGRGRGPANGHWKSFPKCPYCEREQCAGVFEGPHGDLFKCHRTSCPSETAGDHAAWDEIGFLAYELKLDRQMATRAWLREAGLWTENPATINVPTDQDHKEPAGVNVDDEGADDVPESPLQTFTERASLSGADRQELKINRGLSDEMIDRSGFLTNDQSNLAILRALALDQPEWKLVNCGLYNRAGQVCKPSGQFYGYGVIGKKKRLPAELLESGDFDDVDDNDFVWAKKESGLCNPILIPYYDLSGELIGLRPHKGFPKGQKPRLYLAGGRKAVLQCPQAVIVEGEFKAAALQDIVGNDWAVAAVPGITQVKNLHVWADILAWLKRIGARKVAVAFDNEEHGDPKFPGYRPQLMERFEAEVWARVCAVRLEAEGYDEVGVGHLPDEWRNANGKADWDNALATLLKAGKTRSEIRSLFVNVLRQSLPVGELSRAKFYGLAAERIIGDRVAVRTYEPALPWGRETEQKLARELRKLAAGKLREWAGRVILLAEAYEATKGWYYELKISEQRHEKLLDELRDTEGSEHILFLKLAIKGTPSLVACFRIKPYYVLLKPDGGRDRLVKLINIRGEESDLLALDEEALTAPRDLRRWLARSGNFGFEKGERPLQLLQRDLNFYMARCEVKQLVCYGCERPGALWFVDDCAYAGNGALVLPDHLGVFWYEERGYIFRREPEEQIPIGEQDQEFRLPGLPRMHPGMGLVFDPAGKLQLQDEAKDDPGALQELLGNFVLHLNDSFRGSYDGTMLVAATVGFYAGPEIYRQRSEFPGILISGEKGGGKTYAAKWLEAMHGFEAIEAGISLKTSSAVGVQIVMGQYANIPPWCEEYSENELQDPNVKGVIHSGFNREVPSKYSAEGHPRTIRTNLLVTGETAFNNAATMSRFISVVSSKDRRMGTGEEKLARLQWLEAHRQLYFTIGRAVLQQRAQFAARVIEHLSLWERLPELAQTDPRGRFSHGVAYAAFLALNEIIPIYPKDKCAQFQKWLIEKAKTSTQEVADRVILNQFWRDLLSMLASGWFGRTPEEVGRFFKVMENKNPKPPFSEQQLKDAMENPRRDLIVPFLAIRPGPVIACWRKYCRNQGLAQSVSQSDLQADMSARPYFVPGPRHGHQVKFGRGVRHNSYCWIIDLAQFDELGLREVSDEVWANSFCRDGNPENGSLLMDDWVDPRKGELFAFVDALKEKE